MFLFLLCVLLCVSSGFSQIPNEPYQFTTRAVTPNLFFSFRQVPCIQGVFTEDVSQAFQLTRNFTATSCPTRVSTGIVANEFSNAVIGATIADTGSTSAIVSGAVGSSFSGLTTTMSVEIWFSLNSIMTNGQKIMLLEIDSGSTSLFYAEYVYDTGGSSLSVKIQLASNPLFEVQSSGLSLLQSIGTTTGTIFMLILVISNYDSDHASVTAYLAMMGSTTSLENSQDLKSGQISSLSIASNAVVTVGCPSSASASLLSVTCLPGSVHMLGFYNSALSSTDVSNILTAGLPNSIPVTRVAIVSVIQGQNTTLNLDQQNVTYFDFDGNPLENYLITTLPPSSEGNLLYRNATFSADYYFSNYESLTFLQTTPYIFSIAASTPLSECTTPFASFNYSVSDGICDYSTTPKNSTACFSPEPGVAHVCVVDGPDAPTLTPVTFSARPGEKYFFTLVPLDNDDYQKGKSDNQLSTYRIHDPSGNLSTGALIYFQQTTGSYGQITAYSGSTCTTTPVPAQTWVSFVKYSGQTNFAFCYVANSNDEINNTDVFNVRFQDMGGTIGPYSTVTFTIINPLEACPSQPPVPLNLLTNAQGVCTSSGFEVNSTASNNIIPIYLQGSDSLNRAYQYEITTPPLHGKLYLNAGWPSSLIIGEPLTLTNNIVSINVSSTGIANVIYQGELYYFNRMFVSGSTYRYTNLDNLGYNGCFIESQPCRCALTAYPGCPDYFTYQVVLTSGESGSSSGNAVYNIYVNSLQSPMTVSVPSVFKYLTSQAPQFLSFTGSNLVQVMDPDDNAYTITILVVASSSNGLIAMSSPALFSVTLEGNAADQIETGANPVVFFGGVTLVNEILATMAFSSTADVGYNSSNIEITAYKIYPSGTTASNWGYDANSLNGVPYLSKITLTDGNASGGGSNPANGLYIAIIAGASAFGLIVFCCFVSFLVWFVRKSRAAVRSLRKSVPPQRQSQGYYMNENGTQGPPVPPQYQHPELDDEEIVIDRETVTETYLCGCCCEEESDHELEEDRIDIAEEADVNNKQLTGRQSTKSNPGGVDRVPLYSPQRPSSASRPNSQHVVSATPVMVSDGMEVEVTDDSLFEWEKHIDKRTGDVYFFNPKTGVSQWDPPTVRMKRQGK